MGLRFIVRKGGAGSHDNRPLLSLNRAHLSALRTGLFRAQLIRLSQSRDLQRACQQCLDGRHSNIFHLRQRHIQARPLFTPVLLDDDFSPALRQFLDVFEIFAREFARRHVASLQRDASISPDEIVP
jgi:hypothetical protein